MYEYPLAVEAKIGITVPAASNLTLQAWELHLARGAKVEKEIPGDLGPGYIGIVWKGSAKLKLREEATAISVEEGTFVESGLGVFYLEQVEKIILADESPEVRIAVIGVLDANGNNPDLDLPRRGKCNIDPLPMPDIPDDTQRMTLILRQLQFTERKGTPDFAVLEPWSRPGYFLTTISGPQAGDDACEALEDDDGGMDLIVLPAGEAIPYQAGEAGHPLAFIIDFHADGDRAYPRVEQGCNIRCWGP